MSGFSNPIVQGSGQLVRKKIESVGFITGVTGWMIAQDGTAEFNNATVRGTIQVGPFIAGGSSVKIDNAGGQAEILVYPPDQASVVIAPGGIVAFAQTPGSVKPVLQLFSPAFNGHQQAAINLQGVSADGTSDPTITLLAGVATGTIEMGTQDVQYNAISQPMGLAGRIFSNVDSAAIGAVETIVLAVLTPIIRNLRAYEVKVTHTLTGTAASVTTVLFRRSNAAGTSLGGVLGDRFLETDGNFQSSDQSVYIRNDSGADINNASIVVTLQVPAGTVKQTAASTRLRMLEVRDIGASSDYTDAMQF